MKKIRFGVIGLGQMGQMHIAALQYRIPNAEVVAVCARTESKVAAIQEKFSIPRGYTDFHGVIDDPEVDAVIIATGADAHKAPCLYALEHHKHVFCEKPLAKTLDDCKEIEAAAQAHPECLFTIGFMRRFDPAYTEAMRKIRAGEIGTPILYKGVSLDPASVLDAHLAGVKKGIYPPWFLEIGSHETDLALWFLGGKPVECFATGGAYVCTELADYDDYDNGFALTRFDNGTTAFIQVGRTNTCCHVEAEIVGTKGTIRINSVPRKNCISQFTPEGYVEQCQEGFMDRWSDAFYLEIADFTSCIAEGRRPEITAGDGTAGLAFAQMLHQAYLDGKK
ncbi:MAG: Gfo/Idh/MocA family oxidoreductase [Butyricicoccaceae bacterium]